MRKSVLVLLSLVTSITFLVSFMKPKESLYKNLKVLPKDISKGDMDSVMKHFTASLGVKCNFCHVRLDNEKKDWDFANDSLDNKKFARYMVGMTKRINKKYFKDDIKNIDMPQMNEVTCYSCHNGKEKPGKKPRMDQQPPRNDRTQPPPPTTGTSK
ncbi:MAG: c-type cytochrome [Chitinophagaceae bacterium]|nr:c-type cytochrome [Chitinophagaceae bacterium]